MSQQDAVQDLCGEIGMTLVALICGAEKQFDVARWCEGELDMTPGQLERLNVASELYHRVASFEDGDTARKWLTGASCGADLEMTPAMAINSGRFAEARASANTLIECLPL